MESPVPLISPMSIIACGCQYGLHSHYLIAMKAYVDFGCKSGLGNPKKVKFGRLVWGGGGGTSMGLNQVILRVATILGLLGLRVGLRGGSRGENSPNCLHVCPEGFRCHHGLPLSGYWGATIAMC